MDQILNTHRNKSFGSNIQIFLNLPSDFIFNIAEIIIEYNTEKQAVSILRNEIPDNIKKNMISYFDGQIDEYIFFLEENINIFLSNKLPEQQIQKKENLNETKNLGKSYKMNINHKIKPNVKFDCFKSNIYNIFCENLIVTVECNRCCTSNTISQSAECTKCRTLLEMTYVPSLDTEYFGFLEIKKGKLLFFNQTNYFYTCQECMTTYRSPVIRKNETHTHSCYSCSAKLRLRIDSIDFISRAAPIKIKQGEPLPDNGTCKHYKKSLRWFRFPCCNSLFPCDVCHDEASNHECEMADKMVCGLCGKEQSTKKDCDCGMKLKNTSKFWEGGKGNRNKSTMSKKDSKKYRK